MERFRIIKAYRLIATVFYIGYIPWVPATFASMFGLVVVIAAGENIFGSSPRSIVVSGIVIALLFLIGVRASQVFEEETHRKDDRKIVVDELVGMLVALWGIQLSGGNLLTAFIMFRFFDILKPFPIRRAEHLNGGWGIMMDDILAGIYTNLLLRAWMMLM